MVRQIAHTLPHLEQTAHDGTRSRWPRGRLTGADMGALAEGSRALVAVGSVDVSAALPVSVTSSVVDLAVSVDICSFPVAGSVVICPVSVRIPVMRHAVDALRQAGTPLLLWRLGHWRSGGDTAERGTQGDLVEAHEAIDWLAVLGADQGWSMCDIWLLRLRALLARARGDDVAYRELVERYRAMNRFLTDST